jgi:uncharacterized protein YqfA (UPF0365 family)
VKNLSREQLMKQVEAQRELVRAAKEAFHVEVDVMQSQYLVRCEVDRNLQSQISETDAKWKKLEQHEKTLADLQAKLAKMKRGQK